MATYILRRLLMSVPSLFLVVTLVFFVFQLIPGDPVLLYVGPETSPQERARVRKELGLDRPVLVQYTSYMKGLVHGDLGKSIFTRRPVITEIKGRFWNSLKLSLAGNFLAAVLGVPMGTISAVRRGRFWDYFFSVVAFLGISIPLFWMGLLLMYFFSVKLGVLPSAGHETWRHYLMPTASIAVVSTAYITRMTRSSVLEMIGQDYVRTARAKGLPEYLVLIRHVLRNALLPIITIIGLRFGYMLGHALITETIFTWPGMGWLLYRAVAQRDIPVVQGTLLVFAMAFMLINLIVDIGYAFADPQIVHGDR